MIDDYIKILKPIVCNIFKDDSSGHDIEHLERVMRNAIKICEKEGGNKLVVAISSYLHDIHRIMSDKYGRYVTPKESLTIVRTIISPLDLANDQINDICYCIEHHEEYNWNQNNRVNLNAQIVQDADNLDAIGAIGIARAFRYSGCHSIKMFDPNKQLRIINNYREDDVLETNTIEHFYNKLFKLGDNMNTKTGKELAKKRIKFMEDFINEFMEEWYISDRQKTI